MNGLNRGYTLLIIRGFHERIHVTYNPSKENLCKLPPFKTMNLGLDSISYGAVSCGTPLMTAQNEKNFSMLPEEVRQMVWS